MAYFHFKDDIFSPIRDDDTSLTENSINSCGSSISSGSNIEFNISSKDSSTTSTNLLDCTFGVSDKQRDVFEKSPVVHSPVKHSSAPVDEREKTIPDNIVREVDKGKSSKAAISPKEKFYDTDIRIESELQGVCLDAGNSEIKLKEFTRPTQLPLEKGLNSNSLKENKVDINGLKRTLFEGEQHVKSCSSESSLDAEKIGNFQISEKFLMELNDAQNATLIYPNSDSREMQNPVVLLENKINKLIHDQISVEFDAIRQNLYSQQMMFHRELNHIKEQMEKQHVETVDYLCKTIEELAYMNVFLRENA